jgi:hypothetical protein
MKYLNRILQVCLPVAIIAIGIGCATAQQSDKSLKLRYTGQEIHVPHKVIGMPVMYGYEPSQNLMAIVNAQMPMAYIYQITSNKVLDSFSLKNISRNRQFWYLCFISPEQLLLYFNPNLSGIDSYDSSFCIYHLPSKKVKWLNTRAFDFHTRNGHLVPRDQRRYLYWHSSLNYDQGILLASLGHWYSGVSLGDSIAVENRRPLGAYLKLESNDSLSFHEMPIYLPERAYHLEYPGWRAPESVLNSKGNPVFGFNMCPDYIEYDRATRELHRHRLPSVFVDTIYPKLETEPMYFSLFFDRYRKQYWRIVQLRVDPKAPITQQNKRMYSAQIFDESFQLLGEGLLPPELQPGFDMYSKWIRPLFTPQGVFFYNWNRAKSFDGVAVVFQQFEPTFVKENPLKALKKIREAKGSFSDDWKTYLTQELKQPTDSIAYLVLQPEESCPSCHYKMIEYYKTQRKEHPQRGLRLLILYNNPNPLQQTLTQLGLTKEDSFLVLDGKSRNKEYILRYDNPRIIGFKNGKLTVDKILDPKDIPDAPALIDGLYK